MKKVNICETVDELLENPQGEMTEAEFMQTPEGKKVAEKIFDELSRYFEAKRLLRKELCDGDDGHIDGWLSVSKRLGISPLEIKKMGSAEYTSWVCALVREKRRETKAKKRHTESNADLERAIATWNSSPNMTKKELELEINGGNFNHLSYFQTVKKYSDKQHGEGYLREGSKGTKPKKRG